MIAEEFTEKMTPDQTARFEHILNTMRDMGFEYERIIEILVGYLEWKLKYEFEDFVPLGDEK